jgi:DNA-binding YbaB/EbfC family protein
MKGGIGNLMKQAQLMQENMKKLQEQLGVMEIEGRAASGKVRIVMTGRHEVKRVTIDPGLLTDQEMLEDVLAVAINDAVRQVEATVQEKMAGATAGLPLPPGLKLPF